MTKKWRGLLTEVVTDADSYAVTFPMSTDDSVRQLALAAALAVDLTMKQKDYGSPLDLIDFWPRSQQPSKPAVPCPLLLGHGTVHADARVLRYRGLDIAPGACRQSVPRAAQ